MTIRFLFDENLDDPLRSAVARHNARGIDPIDAVQVGDPPDLPRDSLPEPLQLLPARAG